MASSTSLTTCGDPWLPDLHCDGAPWTKFGDETNEPGVVQWDGAENHGIVEVHYDPTTQKRVHVTVNQQAARMLNMDHGELLSRFAWHNVPLCVSDIDAIRIFLVDVQRTSQSCTAYYYRRIVRSEGGRPFAMLVCVTRTKLFTTAGLVCKVTDRIREVSAEEYDMALQQRPTACPLAVMGDWRTGRQLLDAADHDAATSLLQMSSFPGGRAALELLTERVGRLADELAKSQPLDVPPPPQLDASTAWAKTASWAMAGAAGDLPRAVTAGQDQYPSEAYVWEHSGECEYGEREEEEGGGDAWGLSMAPWSAAERPLPYQVRSFRFDRPGALLGAMARRNWARGAARRHWSFGYEAAGLVASFNAVPPPLEAAIEATLSALMQAAARHRESRLAAAALAGGDGSGGGGGGGGGGPPRLPPAPAHSSGVQMPLEEAAMWEADEELGYLEVGYDPVTQDRTGVAINARLASMFGMHREEMLARFADHTVRASLMEVDLLRTFLLSLLTEFDEELVRMMRLVVRDPAAPGGVRAFLACNTTRKVFNSLGQICKVKMIFRVIQPAEYDEALARAPQLCPLAVMGDHRRGSQLLADAAADAGRTVARMAATRDGRQELEGMADRILSRLTGGMAAMHLGQRSGR